MEMIVLWSDSAIEYLQKIHDYYSISTGLKIANKIVDSIVDKTISLEIYPRIRQSEKLLKHMHKEIRYLLYGNYKIVYTIENDYIIIATVFDCRQNPEILKETKI